MLRWQCVAAEAWPRVQVLIQQLCRPVMVISYYHCNVISCDITDGAVMTSVIELGMSHLNAILQKFSGNIY